MDRRREKSAKTAEVIPGAIQYTDWGNTATEVRHTSVPAPQEKLGQNETYWHA